MFDASRERLLSAIARLEMDIKNLSQTDSADKNLIQILLKENTDLKNQSEEIVNFKGKISHLLGQIRSLQEDNEKLKRQLSFASIKKNDVDDSEPMLLDSSSSDDVEVSIKKLKKLVTKKS